MLGSERTLVVARHHARRRALSPADARALSWILLGALVLRLVVVVVALARDTSASPDTITYVRPAESLIATGRFDSHATPELARTPGYPLLLAMGERLGALAGVTLVAQAILGTLTVWLVWRLAFAVGASAGVATIAALIYAVEPSSIIYASKLLAETLFTTIVTALLLSLTAWANGGNRKALVAAAALLALGCYVRPVLYYAPPLLGGAIAIVGWRKGRSWRGALRDAALFLMVAVVPLAAWRARNVSVAGYDGFAAIADVNLLEWRAAGVIARRSGRPLAEVQQQLRRESGGDTVLTGVDREARGWQRTERYHAMRSRARAILTRDPAAVLLDMASSASQIVLGRDTSEWTHLLGIRPQSPSWHVVRALLTAAWLPVLALAGIGLLRARHRLLTLVPALTVSAYLLIVSAGPEGYSRFRLPVVPFATVLAALGVVAVATYVNERVAKRRNPR